MDLYRQLAAARPDAFLPDLAMSLNNLGRPPLQPGPARGGAGGEPGGGRHPPAAGRGAARRLPPRPRQEPEQPGDLLSDLGRREEALAASQEAVDLYRQLAAARPDAFLPDLAMSLNNLGIRLSDLGRREEALAASQEAVDIYRRLAAARPDAFLPDLAMSLNNLANCSPTSGGARRRWPPARRRSTSTGSWPRRGPTPSCPTWPGA